VILNSDFEESERYHMLRKLLETLFPECEIQILTVSQENQTNMQSYCNTTVNENGKKNSWNESFSANCKTEILDSQRNLST
jgi:hypothetical protein